MKGVASAPEESTIFQLIVSGLLSREMSTRTFEFPIVGEGRKVGTSVAATGNKVGGTLGLRVVPGSDVGIALGEDEEVGAFEAEGSDVGDMDADGLDEILGVEPAISVGEAEVVGEMVIVDGEADNVGNGVGSELPEVVGDEEGRFV